MENLEEIVLHGGENIESAVNRLLEAKKQGKHAYCVFNDTYLYSDNVTMDSAYIEICGCTKEEYDKKVEEEILRCREKAALRQKEAIQNIPDKIERGRNLIYPFRFVEWARLVTDDAIALYHGCVTESVLEIMQAIEDNKSMNEIVHIFEEQGHSGMSASLTRKYVLTYSKNGYPFYEETHFGNWTLDECERVLDIMYENEKNKTDEVVVTDVSESRQKVISRVKRLNKLEENSIR